MSPCKDESYLAWGKRTADHAYVTFCQIKLDNFQTQLPYMNQNVMIALCRTRDVLRTELSAKFQGSCFSARRQLTVGSI